jgi:hypothetical protein
MKTIDEQQLTTMTGGIAHFAPPCHIPPIYAPYAPYYPPRPAWGWPYTYGGYPGYAGWYAQPAARRWWW